MALVFLYFLTVLACVLAIPVFVFFVEICASVLFRPRDLPVLSRKELRKSVAILVPAHNESAGVQLTLENIKPQLLPGDRLLVVADNCTDDTAAVATAAGTEVISRGDPTKIGKGYALDFGIKHLGLNPPDIVVFIDADCKAADGAIDRLTAICAATNRPVQALYLMSAPHESPVKYHVAEFAWRVKNWVRPLGLNALNLPCQLMGSGMAFPWEVIRAANLAHGSIVEDMQLGLELARSGSPPLFCPSAKLTSHFPWSIDGAKSQRKRWEEGHIGMILTAMPHFFYAAISHRNTCLLALTLDLIVPPLSLLVLVVAGIFLAAVGATALSAGSAALIVSTVSICTLAVAVFLAWIKCGYDILPIRSVPLIAHYGFAKLSMYRQIFSGRFTSRWTRTDRSKSRASKHSHTDT